MMRDAFWMLSAVVLTTFLAFGSPAGACSAQARVEEMSAEQVASALARKAPLRIFDANSRERYAQGHVPTAQWVPFNELTASLLPQDRTATLIFYCYNALCSASTTAARRAVELGYTHVYVMPEGIEGWLEAGRAVEPAARGRP